MRKLTTLALLSAPVLAASLAPAQERRDDEALVVATTLANVRANPHAFKNVRVQMTVQFCSLGRVANPFFTRFEAALYANFYAWPDGEEIWQRERYDDLFGMFFMAKANEKTAALYDLETYDRVHVDAIVRNVFQGSPWIEVLDFEPVEGRVNTATLAHLNRAETHMARRDWRRAISELSLAPAGPTPAFVQAAVHKNLGLCYLRLGEADRARSHLATAESLADGDRRIAQLAHTARVNPAEELDRNVDRTGIGEADRPLWEAFESDAPGPAPLR